MPNAAARQALADTLPFILWMHDEGGTLTYVNRRWTEYTGLDLAATLQVGPERFVHPDDLQQLRLLFERAAASGEPIVVHYRMRRAQDGAYRWHEARVASMRDAASGRISFVGTALDVDTERRVSEQQRFLAEAGAVLGTSLDVQRTLSDVARMVVPGLADWCAVDVPSADGQGFERLAVAHVDPAKVRLAHDIWVRLPPRPDDPRGMPAVVRTGTPEVHEDIPDALLVEALPDAELLALFRALGLRSSMCVPLKARGTVLGALTLVAAESGRRYGPEDLRFAQDFASRIAVALDNARLYSEAQAARTAAEAMATELQEQSRTVERALLQMRGERDAARAQLAAQGRSGNGAA